MPLLGITSALLLALSPASQAPHALAAFRVPHAPAAFAHPALDRAPGDSTIYVVYYWRARPGKMAEYSDYIREHAEPIDEAARQTGAFEEIHTYTQFLQTGAPGADWTHMRVFRLKSFAQLDGLSAALDAASKRVFPDEEQRKRDSERVAGLRDLVRQEIWKNF